MPTLSILIPAYNHESYIISTLESVRHQNNLKEIEIVLIDDSSTDQTFEKASIWAKSFGNEFRSITLMKNEFNLGINRTLNKLVDLAKGEYVKFLASDDKVVPYSLYRAVQFLEARNLDFIHHNGFYMNQEGVIQGTPIVSSLKSFCLRNKNFMKIDLVFNFGLPWAFVFGRTSSLREIGQFPECLIFEDRWVALKIVSDFKSYYYKEPIHIFRKKYEKSMTAGLDMDILLNQAQDIDRDQEKLSKGLIKNLLLICNTASRSNVSLSKFGAKLVRRLYVSTAGKL